MLYLSPASTEQVRDAMRAGLLGQIRGVNAGNRLEPGVPTALDNGCFPAGCFAPSWDESKWLRFVDRAVNDDTLFTVVPDVPFDADRTSEAFDKYADVTPGPLAYATQNGCTEAHVPWDRIAFLFTAGDNRWKLGAPARVLMEQAKARGVKTHMGRVNTLARLTIAARHGYDSVDGTYIARAPDENLPNLLRYLRTARRLAEHPSLEVLGSKACEELPE